MNLTAIIFGFLTCLWCAGVSVEMIRNPQKSLYFNERVLGFFTLPLSLFAAWCFIYVLPNVLNS